MNSWVGSVSLYCWLILTACTTPLGLGISIVELEDDKFGLEGQTKDERSESSITKNSHGLLSMMNETLWEKNKWFEDDEIGWISNKGADLHLTTLLLYILSDLLFSYDSYNDWDRTNNIKSLDWVLINYVWFALLKKK